MIEKAVKLLKNFKIEKPAAKEGRFISMYIVPSK